MKTQWILALLVLATAMIGAVSQAQTPDASWQAPPEVAARKNPAASSPDAVKHGQKLYAENCAGCHGPKGVPSLKTATNFQQPVQESDGALFWKITTGNPKHGMPSFQRLTDEHRWELVSYIRTLSAR